MSFLPSNSLLTSLVKNLMMVNQYEYAASNTCNYTDPTGLDHCGLWGGLAAAAAAVGPVAAARIPRCARAT